MNRGFFGRTGVVGLGGGSVSFGYGAPASDLTVRGCVAVSDSARWLVSVWDE